MNAYFDAMRRYVTFGGRSTRAQFWLFTLIVVILGAVAAFLDGASGGMQQGEPGIVSGIVILAHFIPGLAVSVRRLHDIDRSGWWVLIGLVPLVGLIVLLVFACTASTPGPNRFGPPAGQDNAAQPPVTPRSVSESAALDQIEKLAALHKSGAINDEEFQQMKAKAMGLGAS